MGSKEWLFRMGPSQDSPLQSHSMVCIENHLFIVVIGQNLNKELGFIYQSYSSDCMYVYSKVSEYTTP